MQQTRRKKTVKRRSRTTAAAKPAAPYTFRSHPMPFLLAGVAVLAVVGLAAAAMAPLLRLH